MSDGYEVIARRWRPQSFDDLVGQDHIVRTLRNAIEGDRIAHAYLFVGPRGTGKTSTARLFAKSLNCTGGPSVVPPKDCEICEAIMKGGCMDVIEIDGASNNSVDQVRDLRDDCQYAPGQCRFKIYIIDEVHMLSTAAFNALLKTLEEPPAHVKFIFATTEVQKVLPTIVSRCQRLEFRPISDEVIASQLKRIGESEEIEASDGVYSGIARLANGGMRDAQSILDQMIAFCGKKIDESDLMDMYGMVSEGELKSLYQAMLEGEFNVMMDLVDKLDESGRDLLRVLVDLRGYVHRELRGKLTTGGDEGPRKDSLMRVLDILGEGEERLKMGLSERVNFEVILMKAMEAARLRPIDDLIGELASVAKGLPASVGESKKKEAVS